jgi:hypothetical protein
LAADGEQLPYSNNNTDHNNNDNNNEHAYAGWLE